MLQAVRSQFEQQRDQILANLDPSRIGKSYTRKDWLKDLIDWTGATDSLRQAIQPIVFSTLLETGKEAMHEVGRDASMFDPYAPALRAYFQDRSLRVAQDINDETAKQLRASLSEGVAAGESTFDLRARVESVMGSASTMRADRIARTEVAGAQGFADIQAWTQSGVVEGKEWFTAEDEHVCPFCDQLDGSVIGLNDTFFDDGDTYRVGDQAQKISYGDIASAPLHPNCRCTLLPVRS